MLSHPRAPRSDSERMQTTVSPSLKNVYAEPSPTAVPVVAVVMQILIAAYVMPDVTSLLLTMRLVTI